MPTSESRQRAARAWCTDATKDRVMDVALADAFAEILDGESDTKLLNYLQSQTMGYGDGWVLRASVTGRGMRLHEHAGEGCAPDVRQAILNHMGMAKVPGAPAWGHTVRTVSPGMSFPRLSDLLSTVVSQMEADAVACESEGAKPTGDPGADLLNAELFRLQAMAHRLDVARLKRAFPEIFVVIPPPAETTPAATAAQETPQAGAR